MKQDNLLKGAAVLGALALMAGGMVAADAAVNNYTGRMTGLTDAEKTAKIAEREANRTANQAAMEAKHTAVETAISASDYDAWVAAEGTSNPMVTKVTKDNFAQFVEAHNLMEQAHTILTGIGLGDGPGHGFGMGLGMGGGHMLDR
ncbi:MAG TPA: hypothetical protein VFD16_02425 [Candidatus Saccharimonadales bacterium]|nr:hypothetical protein [Candidatus Saccharimonadales bacterium]